MNEAFVCRDRRGGTDLDLPFAMAFHPIVDVAAGCVWGYEALVRGPRGEAAASVLSQVNKRNLYKFDQACWVKAIELAGRLFQDSRTRLSINLPPNAVYEPAACIRALLDAAQRVGFRRDQLVFEFTENERVTDTGHLTRIVAEYRRQGFLTALDDFGADYAGLCLLASFQTDLIKIDMHLVRGIDQHKPRQAIVAANLALSHAHEITVIAEGVETEAELRLLQAAGATLFPGYHFAVRAVTALPPVQNAGPARCQANAFPDAEAPTLRAREFTLARPGVGQ